MVRVLFLVLVLSGCASPYFSMPVDQFQQLRGKTVTTVDGHKLMFQAHTAAGAIDAITFMSTAAGPTAIATNYDEMYAIGAHIVNKYNIADPSDALKKRLVDFLQEQYGLGV